MKLFRNIVFILLVFGPFLGAAQNIPSRPNPPRLVNDYAEVLSPDQEAQLEQKLVAYDDSTSNQIAIVTVKTLEGYPIEEYALKLFRDWQIGNKATNNGALILAVIDDRQIRIEVGYGLEGAIPDITANQIIRNDITPAFRGGDYYDGFDKATESIIKAAAGEYKAPEGYGKGKSGKGIGGLVIAFIIFIFILSSINRRGGGGGGGFVSRRGYRDVIGPMILGSLLGGGRGGGGGWSGGGGGWSGGGGGFGGFGGGSSGGGGASGSW